MTNLITDILNKFVEPAKDIKDGTYIIHSSSFPALREALEKLIEELKN